MKRIIYHGTTRIFENPTFGFGNIHNDYGLGFYCTEKLDLAKEWACQKNNFGYANEYVIDDSNLKILDLREVNGGILTWLSLLIKNRKLQQNFLNDHKNELEILSNYEIDITSYDVIIGFRADDNYFQFPLAFLENKISVESLERIFMLGNLGTQYVLMSKKSFSKLKFNQRIIATKENQDRYKERLKEAKEDYEIIIREQSPFETYIRDLVRKYYA